MAKAPFVSVVMPVRNEAGFIQRSLGAVLEQDYPNERIEILIADGQSTDDTREIIREMARGRSNVNIVDNPGRIVATGLNTAIRVANGDIVVRVDGHCEIKPDYVSRCVTALLDTGADGVGGPVETVGETYTATAIAAAMSSGFGVGGSAFRTGLTEARFADTAPFPAYTRETLRHVGEFDEELVRNQDDEYNYRLRKLGGRILLSPDIRSRYYSRATLKSLWKQYSQYGYWKVRVMQKHPLQMKLRQFFPPLLVAVVLALALTSPVLQVSQLLLTAVGAVYAGAAMVSAIALARKTEWRLLPLLPVTFAILHIGYGAGFLLGLIMFWNRWQVAGREKVIRAERDAATF